MPKDFAKLSRPDEDLLLTLEPETKSIPIWVWVLGALLIGNMLLFVAKYNKKLKVSEPIAQAVEITDSVTVSIDSSSVVTETITKTTATTAVGLEDNVEGKAIEKVAEKTDLDFYVELAKVDVLGEIEAPKSAKRKPKIESTKKNSQPKDAIKSTATNVTKKKALENTGYLLQVGSFKSSNDAERFLQRLKTSGFSKVYIQEAEVNGDTWHRVMLGRYDRFELMNSKRQALKLLGFDSMQITLKQ